MAWHLLGAKPLPELMMTAMMSPSNFDDRSFLPVREYVFAVGVKLYLW